MPRDFLPAIWDAGNAVTFGLSSSPSLNVEPYVIEPGTVGAIPRQELVDSGKFTPASANDRGRGIYTFGGIASVYLDQDTYYYSGGSQDLTVTSAPGHANNTGFNDESIASFLTYNQSGNTQLVITNAGHISTSASAKHGSVWYVGSGAQAPNSITDTDLPCNSGTSITRGGVSLDGYLFIGDINGKIRNSSLNDITTWAATDFIEAERFEDYGVYLGRHQDNVVYIGTKSIEFFYNNGNANGSPLARRQDVYYTVGCIMPNTILEIGDIIYFAGQDAKGTVNMYKLENFTLSIIGDLKIQEILTDQSEINQNITNFSFGNDSVWLTSFPVGGSPGLLLTMANLHSYFYHQNSGIWNRWTWGAEPTFKGSLASWTNVYPVVASNFTGVPGSSATEVQLINGWIGYQGPSYDDDAIDDLGEANAPDSWVRFKRWDAGTRRKKRINWIRVISHPFASNSANFETTNATLMWADHSKSRTNPSGNIPGSFVGDRVVDLNLDNNVVRRCGTTRERSFVVQFTEGHGLASPLLGLEIDYDLVE